jgi:hypothetical protein
MRVVLATAVLLGLGLFGYAAIGGGAVQGQPAQILNVGEKVIFRFAPPDNGSRNCTVVAIRGDFVQCETGDPSAFAAPKSPERWYNMRMVAIVDRPARE